MATGGGGGEESRVREGANGGGEGRRGVRLGFWAQGWVGWGVLGGRVGWWEGAFVKLAGGVCKNDTIIEFLLLRVEIKLSRRVKAQIILMWVLHDLDVLD
jgi:hypothetical protein